MARGGAKVVSVDTMELMIAGSSGRGSFHGSSSIAWPRSTNPRPRLGFRLQRVTAATADGSASHRNAMISTGTYRPRTGQGEGAIFWSPSIGASRLDGSSQTVATRWEWRGISDRTRTGILWTSVRRRSRPGSSKGRGSCGRTAPTRPNSIRTRGSEEAGYSVSGRPPSATGWTGALPRGSAKSRTVGEAPVRPPGFLPGDDPGRSSRIG